MSLGAIPHLLQFVTIVIASNNIQQHFLSVLHPEFLIAARQHRKPLSSPQGTLRLHLSRCLSLERGCRQLPELIL